MRYLVTGVAGFIGSTLTERLLAEGHEVVGIDNFDPFYPEKVKRRNIRLLKISKHFTLHEGDIRDTDLFSLLGGNYDAIIHIAAKAGVRPSILKPLEYEEVNIKGTQNLLEFAKDNDIKHFIFASSSSVYGINPNVPWQEDDYVLQPISPYAATKVSCELIGHTYSHLYDIRFIALRFFTVYGPKQRPDLAIHKFVHKILKNEPIPVFGDGSTKRDYTYIDDIINGLMGAIQYKDSRYEIINLGSGRTVSLSEMIETIEDVFGKKAIINRLPMQAGDVPQTYANIEKARKLLGYNPSISFKEGITKFKEWYNSQV